MVMTPSVHTKRSVARPAAGWPHASPFNAIDSLTTASFVALPWGTARVVIGPQGLLELGLDPPGDALDAAAPNTDPAHHAVRVQLLAYARHRLTEFSLPIDPQGTPFERAVWAALLRIPYGETRTYGDVAAAIGHAGSARAVGLACRSNPIGVVIPCHRVVGADGSLTGYAGGLDLKAKLLSHENSGRA